MDVYLTRTVSGFAPADDATKEAIRKIKLGRVVKASVVSPRNLAHHRKFFALIQAVWSATGDWQSVEDLLIELKIRLGITKDVVIRESGEIVKIVGSISFAAMDQAAFDAFYTNALQTLCVMAGGIEEESLRDEVINQLAAA